MSTSPAQSVPLVARSAWPAGRHRSAAVVMAVCGVVMVAAIGPLLWKFFVDLWSRPQYEFFPLLLLAIPFVAVTCLKDAAPGSIRPGRVVVGVMIWAVALAVLAAGGAMYLRWFAPVAAWVTLLGIGWMAGGVGLLRALWPVGVLLLLILPPPGQYDAAVLVALRQMAVACAGRMLELLNVPHFLHGAVIDIPGDRLMVEEACSGINSMLAVLAFTVLLAFWRRLPVKSLLILLPAAFAFVFWANVGRITVCAAAKVWWGLDLLVGAPHELMGIGLFAGCMALVFSTERLGQWLMGWDDEIAEPPRPATPTARGAPAATAVGVWVATAAVFLAVGAWTGARTWRAWPESALPAAGAFRMPPELDGWTRVDDPERGPDAEVSGRQSRLWQYRRGPMLVTVGVDYPFSGYHEATTCYALAGWTLTESREVLPAGVNGPVRRDVVMSRPPLSQAVMAFALCDEAGNWWRRPAAVGAESFVRQRLRWSYERATSPPLAQLQILRVAYSEPTIADRQAIATLFDAVAAEFARQVRDLAAAGRR